ncbi:MAG TPA: STAS domain-containing protein [Aggregatilinea sp.]|jgi:anti-anti-sigma factor|uniref:STAS domain-containing protein n=1 Tax=Aggregatilinea sp. TaxID=2806333 RepID=UPI002B5101AC|nr:STAS domain-containing protein [Aggregatilinea sp.]HML22419.1 STAS domain-containing protein [Aggregatilinea sp.]
MNITERDENGVAVFVLDGRVDSEGAVDLDMALRGAVTEGKHKMILDMSQVRYINSAGLRTLADILTENRAAGGDLRLVDLNPKVRRIFQIIGFDRFFDIDNTLDEALAAF